MSFSQALCDRMAAIGSKMYGSLMEPCTLIHRSAPGLPQASTPGIPANFANYRARDIDGQVILSRDQQVRIATSSVPGNINQEDELQRGDNTRWKVLSATGGPGDPWWLLQCRQIG